MSSHHPTRTSSDFNATKKTVINKLNEQMEQMVDELTRRQSGALARRAGLPPPNKSFKLSNPRTPTVPIVKLDTAKNGKIPVKEQTQGDDPNHLLNIWLSELDSLQKGLEGSLDLKPRDTKASYAPCQTHCGGVNSRESTATPVHIRRMSTPRVESPRLDSHRYSLINLEETLEHDLDAILGELCTLETSLGGSKSTSCRKGEVTSIDSEDILAPPPPPPPPLSTRENITRYLQSVSEPQYITAETVRQNKMSKRADSPDNDSAFCDNVSSNSSNDSSGNKANAIVHADVPAPRRDEDPVAKAKAEKIRLAIEKIKEASIKKIFIKVFSEDGSAKSLLVDERMTVAQVCRMLAEKNHQKRDTIWGLVELLPDLHMERAYEDHEYLVENLLMWKADSKNTLWFIKRPEVFDLFTRPEIYLLGDASSQCGAEMDDRSRSELVEEYFSSTGIGAPEVEGILWLKAEGKKNWKRFYFILRSSGLYYSPKGRKTSKDLICLATFDVNQVYYGVKWQPKFKSPTRHCFAIKHPQIQAKNPKYIRYLCADTDEELNKWVTGIRIAKYGRILYENFRAIIEENVHDDIDRLASARLSVGSNGQNGSQKMQHFVTLADQQKLPSRPSHHHHHNPKTENGCMADSCSFDSALQMSDSFDSCLASKSQSSLFQPGKTYGSSRIPASSLSSRSASFGSLSEKSSSALSSVELGFSCDSPEGGTIKKKPAIVSNVKKCNNQNELKRTAIQKEVRFKETFSTIPDTSSNSFALARQRSLPPPPPPPLSPPPTEETSTRSRMKDEGPLYQSLVEALIVGRQGRKSRQPEGTIAKHLSDESLSSGSTMAHTVTLTKMPPAVPSPRKTSQQSQDLLSPQPSRPAPVLKSRMAGSPVLLKI